MVGEVVRGQIFLAMLRNLDFIGRLLEDFEEGSDQIRFFFSSRKGSHWVVKLKMGLGRWGSKEQ